MKYLPITILLLLINLQVYSQQNWVNYTNDIVLNDVEVDGNDVWIGSHGGLTKTNLETGEIETYLAHNSPIIGGGIFQIEKAPDGSFWFGSVNAGIFNYKNGEWIHYYENIISEAYERVSHLQILPNGDVWFFVNRTGGPSDNKLFRIRNGVVENFPNLPMFQRSFCVSNENTIYFSFDRVLYKYDVGQKEVVETWTPDNSILTEDDNFMEIAADKNGAVIISSINRILKLENDNLTVLADIGIFVSKAFHDVNGNTYLQPYANDVSGIRLIKYDGVEVTYYRDENLGTYPENINPIFKMVDGEGGLYASFFSFTTDFLLYRYDGNEWTPVDSEIFPISDNFLSDVQSDCDGNLWFGGHLGVDVRYADGTWGNFSTEIAEYSSFYANNMTVDPVTCDVWFANPFNNGSSSTIPGIVRISNGIVTKFLKNYAHVTDIEANVDGKVYFYSLVEGFGYIENDEVNFIDEFEQGADIFSIDSDSKGNIYLVDYDLGLIKYDGENFNYLGSGEGSNVAYNVMVDNDDFVWITTPSGLMQFDGINWNSYVETWPKNTINSLVQDKKGNYWVATRNDGLYYWDKDNIQNYTIFNSGLNTNHLRYVALDPEGNLIVTQSIGASVLSIPNNIRNYKGTGTVFYDSDKNGLYEEGSDVLVPGQKVRAEELNVWSITNPSGEYTFYSDEVNEHSFQHEIGVKEESTTDNPQLASIFNNNSVLPDFGFWKELEEDVGITIYNGVPVCNRDFKVYINLRNQNIEEVKGDLILKHDNFLTILDSSIPISQQSDDEIIFEDISIDGLQGKSIQITVEAPGIEVDETEMFFDAIFETANNQFSANTSDQVLCSYDPNDKKVEATGDFKNDFSLIKDALKYTIRFQNEGTYKAFDIAVIDTLDTNLDPSTFELLASSHRVETNITDAGIVTFNFPNIDLPPKDEDDLGSQGFVSFTVKPYSDTENFEMIHNTASIYFDFNPPIVTNTTEWNVVDDLSLVGIQEVEHHVYVYPNPSDGTIQINLDENSMYRIMDVSGQLLDKGVLVSGLNAIKLDVYPGVYLLQVTGTSGDLSTKKLVIF